MKRTMVQQKKRDRKFWKLSLMRELGRVIESKRKDVSDAEYQDLCEALDNLFTAAAEFIEREQFFAVYVAFQPELFDPDDFDAGAAFEP